MSATKGYIQLLFLLAAGLLAGCSRDNEPEQRNEIALVTGVHSMLRRVSTVDNSSLLSKELRVDAYFHGTDTKYLDTKKLIHVSTPSAAWIFWSGSEQEHYYWPFDGTVYTDPDPDITYTSLDFVGACPYDLSEAGYYYVRSTGYAHASGTSFTCDLARYMTSAQQDTMKEYTVAVLNEQTLATQTAASGALPMAFKHPFAQIKFVIAEASGTHVTVDSIGIAGLYTAATCAYNGTAMSWTGHSGNADLKIIPATPLHYDDHTQTVTMMVIPNNYGAKTLSVRASWDDWSVVEKQTISANINFNWQAGYIYTYNLTVTPYALVVDTEKYTEQW